MQGHSTKIVSHLSLLYKPLLGGLARPRPGSEAGWLFPSRSRSKPQQPASPSHKPQKYLCLAETGCCSYRNESRTISSCPYGSLGNVPATSCPSVAHAMPDTD